MKTIVPLIMIIVVVLVMLIYNVEENGGMRQVTQMGKQIRADVALDNIHETRQDEQP